MLECRLEGDEQDRIASNGRTEDLYHRRDIK